MTIIGKKIHDVVFDEVSEVEFSLEPEVGTHQIKFNEDPCPVHTPEEKCNCDPIIINIRCWYPGWLVALILRYKIWRHNGKSKK